MTATSYSRIELKAMRDRKVMLDTGFLLFWKSPALVRYIFNFFYYKAFIKLFYFHLGFWGFGVLGFSVWEVFRRGE